MKKEYSVPQVEVIGSNILFLCNDYTGLPVDPETVDTEIKVESPSRKLYI